MKNRNLKHSDNWSTPEHIYNALNQEFNFDFDPCPLFIGNIPPEKDGLLINWGLCNFVNPPYSRKLKEAFILKAYKESLRGKKSVLLIPVSTSTNIFHDIIQPYAKEIRFVRGRIKFKGINTFGQEAKDNGMHDSMIVVFHNDDDIKFLKPQAFK